MKKSLITGNGQDSAYLAELLLKNGHEVYIGSRRNSNKTTWRTDFLGITSQINFIELDLLEYSNVFTVIKDNQFDEVYNLGAMSFVGTSFAQPVHTLEVDGRGVLYLLDAIKTTSPYTRFYQASTSEMYGKVQETPQKETTPFYPRSPYGVAKLYGHWMTVNYRESYNLHASCGILFNHESELRGIEFVTRKITDHIGRLKVDHMPPAVKLGNLDAKRDWGHARDYVKAMYLMLRQDLPDDYVIATGETHSVREFLEIAFNYAGYNIEWHGHGAGEYGLDKLTGKKLVEVDAGYYRPAEVELLLGDSSKAEKKLGWKSEINFNQLVGLMVSADIDRYLDLPFG